MNCGKAEMLLYAVTDRSWLNGRTVVEQAADCLAGGATFLQLREKELGYDAFLAEAEALTALCKAKKVPFVINDNVDIAIACGADGVHIGQTDGEVEPVRRRLGEGKIMGVSVQTVEQALAAQNHGADYLGVGAVFATGTKQDADRVSHKTLREICTAVSIPVVAIGGICAENIQKLAGTGIDGVAVISALFAQPDITAATRKMRELSRKAVGF